MFWLYCFFFGGVFVVSRYEYMGMIGVFGAIISAIQMAILERENLQKVDFHGKKLAYASPIPTLTLWCVLPTTQL